MNSELLRIFERSLNAHYSKAYGISKKVYIERFSSILVEELEEAPTLNQKSGNLATYIKLSILALSLAKLLKEFGLSEYEIGERIYKTADEYFRLSPLMKWVKRTLFFTKLNIRQIKNRQKKSNEQVSGINGFMIELIEGPNKNSFGVDYLQCGICEYYKRRDMFEYVKYCCLVDYAIMKNMGIGFSRTSTLGNGGSKCDFRFNKNGPTVEGWPPTNLPEFKKR
jgi:hypothetical protein